MQIATHRRRNCAAWQSRAPQNPERRQPGARPKDRTGSSNPPGATTRARCGCSCGAASTISHRPSTMPRTSCRSCACYFIGGPNKMWSADAYDDIERNHPSLWMIEANSTYRGWFTGGDQTGEWDNRTFVTNHLAGRGALGNFFASLLQGTLKMGDSPSVAYVLQSTREDPSQSGWGGRFVRMWDGRKTVFQRQTTADDTVEAFGMVEFALPVPQGMSRAHSATNDRRRPCACRRASMMVARCDSASRRATRKSGRTSFGATTPVSTAWLDDSLPWLPHSIGLADHQRGILTGGPTIRIRRQRKAFTPARRA